MRKTTKLSPQAALRPQDKVNTPLRTGGGEATCLTYTLSLPDLTITSVDASDGVAAPVAWIDKHITAAWPEAASPLMALIERVLQTCHPAAAPLDHPAGALESALAMCLPIMDAVGVPTQLLLVVTVVAAPTPEVAVAEPAKLMQIIDHLPVGVLWTDMQGRVKYANEKQRSISNHTLGATIPPENMDSPYSHWLKPDTHEPYRWHELPIPQTIATGASAEVIVTNGFLRDGDDQTILMKIQPVFDNAGQMSDIIAVQIDLTAQYHAEQEAMRRAAEQDTIIDGMIDGLIIYDRHGKPTRYNQAVLRMLGWSQTAGDPLGMSEAERVAFYDAHIITGGAVGNITWPSVQALAGDHPEPVEIAFCHPDGSRVITYVHAVPLRDPVTNEITGAATVVRDITELRQLDYMKDEFMSVASHELRTPLTSLLLASRLMQRWITRDDRAEDLLRLADDMAGQVKRMDRLINNMLDLTRINAQHFAMVPQPTDIMQMVRSAIAEQHAASGRVITYAGVQTAIPVNIDSERMRQVLANILSNADKYDTSGLPIEVTTALVADYANCGAAHVVLAVRDHGYGITEDRLPHLFEQGYHNPDAVAVGQNLDGMGLSLYICQAIVERHGGKIWAKSAIGAGSTFYIELPASPPSGYFDEPTFHMQQAMLQ